MDASFEGQQLRPDVGSVGVDLMGVSRDQVAIKMVTDGPMGETVNRAAIGGLMEVARCVVVGKTKLVEVDLCRIRRDGHDSLRIAEIATDLVKTYFEFFLALRERKRMVV